MVAFFSSWAQGIIVAVIVATIVELLLPNGSSKKYVKVVVGIYILFSIIAPVVNKFANQNINTNEIFDLDKYEEKMQNSNNSILQKIESNNSRTVKDIYVSNLEVDIKAKLKDKGYEVASMYIKAKDDENYTIEKISMTINKNEKKEIRNEITIGTITINKSKNNTITDEKISSQDKQEIKEYLAKTYDISEKIIDIN